MKGGIIAFAVMVVAVVVIGAPALSTRKLLTVERNDIQNRWLEVDHSMKCRTDLIPDLLRVAKTYARQDQAIFSDISSERSALYTAHTKQEEMEANNRVYSLLSHVLALQETYPRLKSDENFARLQTRLEDAENQIAIARLHYNGALSRYNTDLELFPNNIAASLFGFQRVDDYFKTAAEEHQPR